MSLINDALKKLQSAKQEVGKSTSDVYNHLLGHKVEKNKKNYFVVLTTALMLLVLIVGLYILNNTNVFAHSHLTPEQIAPKVDHPKSEIKITPQKIKKGIDTDKLFKEVVNKLKAGEKLIGQSKLYKIIAINPEFNKARELLVVLLLQQKKLSAAEVVLNKGLILSPDYIPFIQLKAQILMGENKNQEALAFLEDYSPSLKANPDYYLLKASLEEMLDDYHTASIIYTRLINSDPENGRLWLGLGVAYQGEGKDSQAKLAFSRALTYGGLTPTQQVYVRSEIKSN